MFDKILIWSTGSKELEAFQAMFVDAIEQVAQKFRPSFAIYFIKGIDDHQKMWYFRQLCALDLLPRVNEEALELSSRILMNGIKAFMIQGIREWFVSQSKVICNRSNDPGCGPRLLEMARAEKIAS